MTDTQQLRTVALVTLGCARNEVDSEELAGRLAADGFQLVDDPETASTVVVNTCGFVESAKKDSVDTLLAAADLKESGVTQAVVAVGCMAERYGSELAESMPEADAVLGFDDYADIGARLRSILAGEQQHPHTPQDRRKLLPISPADRAQEIEESRSAVLEGDVTKSVAVPGFVTTAGAASSTSGRKRLDSGPMAPLKLASGCDRRCSFCAIPSFRGAFVSRRPSDVIAEARWLAGEGVKELFLVSENSTSYGKDLGDLRLLETILPELAAIDGIDRVRVSYLQPAETRPGLVKAIATTPGVADYFDLSFQHAAPTVLRRMRRFGDPESFQSLLESARNYAPTLGARSNFIVGFPGETEAEFQTLCDFITAARLDAVGVFGYSDEDGTEAEGFEDKLPEDVIAERVAHLTDLAEELTAQRAAERLGEAVRVLVESVGDEDGELVIEGRAACQGPEVDGATYLVGEGLAAVAVGDFVEATVIGTEGVDLLAELAI